MDRLSERASNVATLELICLAIGTALLCYALSWALGLGIGLLVYFHKQVTVLS